MSLDGFSLKMVSHIDPAPYEGNKISRPLSNVTKYAVY